MFTEGHDERACEFIAQSLSDRRNWAEREQKYIEEIEALQAKLKTVEADVLQECQLIVARTNTTYRENPGMGFSSTIEDKTAKMFKDEVTKQLDRYAEKIRQGGE